MHLRPSVAGSFAANANRGWRRTFCDADGVGVRYGIGRRPVRGTKDRGGATGYAGGANNRRRRAAKGHAKEEREERAELAPFGEDYGSGGLNRAEIDLFDDDGL